VIDQSISDSKYIQPGEMIAERYVVERTLGEGAMGVVYLVNDTLLEGLPVALKLLDPEIAANKEFFKRFFREVELTRVVNHPAVVRTYEVGTHQGLPFFTMEYCPARPINQFKTTFFKKIERFVSVTEQICDGLTAIHSVGILHRDLKPENILVTDGLQVKIADFGVARKNSSNLTMEQAIIGSPGFLAPEVWQGGEIGPGVDLYALGVILYELLTGIQPFNADTLPRLMWMHINQTPRTPREVDSEIPEYISSSVMRLLSKSAAERFSSPEELKIALTEKQTQQVVAPSVMSEQKATVVEAEAEEDEELPSAEQFFSQFPTAEQIAEYEKKVAESRRRQEQKLLEEIKQEEEVNEKRKLVLILLGVGFVLLVVLLWLLISSGTKQEEPGFATRGEKKDTSGFIPQFLKPSAIQSVPQQVFQAPTVWQQPAAPSVPVAPVAKAPAAVNAPIIPYNYQQVFSAPRPVAQPIQPPQVIPAQPKPAAAPLVAVSSPPAAEVVKFDPSSSIPATSRSHLGSLENYRPLTPGSLNAVAALEDPEWVKELGKQILELTVEKYGYEEMLHETHRNPPSWLTQRRNQLSEARDELKGKADTSLQSLSFWLDLKERLGSPDNSPAENFWSASPELAGLAVGEDRIQRAEQLINSRINYFQGEYGNILYLASELALKERVLQGFIDGKIPGLGAVEAQKRLSEVSEKISSLESQLAPLEPAAVRVVLRLEP
jgi:hypothetical protein